MLASMNASIPELLTDWEFYPVSAAVLLIIFLPYTWGWLRLRRTPRAIGNDCSVDSVL